MIRLHRLPLAILLALLLASGCEQTSEPTRRDILGSWRAVDFPVQISMTLAETARSIDGAGGWTEDGISTPFRVSGALARDEVSLYFDFDDRADVSFQGIFSTEHRIQGVFFGAAVSGQTVTFGRERLED